MTSWLEPLGRDRARRARARRPGPERRPWMAGRVAAPGTVLQVDPNECKGPRSAGARRPLRFSVIFTAMNASIVRLDGPLEPDVSTPAADRLLVGVPEHRVWNYFTDSTQTFFAGRWSGTRGKWRVRYTENELCVMTAGRVVITSDTGERSEFGPGAAFVVPAGFTGTWEVLEDCAKVYAIFEPRT